MRAPVNKHSEDAEFNVDMTCTIQPAHLFRPGLVAPLKLIVRHIECLDTCIKY